MAGLRKKSFLLFRRYLAWADIVTGAMLVAAAIEKVMGRL